MYGKPQIGIVLEVAEEKIGVGIGSINEAQYARLHIATGMEIYRDIVTIFTAQSDGVEVVFLSYEI